MLRAGVVGVGHLGRHHARIYNTIEGVSLTAVADTDPRRRFEAAIRSGARSYEKPEDMIGRVDIVSIVVPTSHHLVVALPFIEAGVHVLIEKPLAPTGAEARALCAAAAEAGVVLQVGHIERFNPAIRAAEKIVSDPRYIVADRIAPYTFRSADIGVVLDLMVHDIDIILELTRSRVKRIESVGVPVMSAGEDIADARINFECGALADIRCSRVSFNRMRKIRFFQSDAYVSIDYNARKVWCYRKKAMDFDASTIDPHEVKDPMALVRDKYLSVQEFTMSEEVDALTQELRSFAEACRGEHPPVVPGEHGARAVEVAETIQSQIHDYIIGEARRSGMPIPDFLKHRSKPSSP